MMGLLLMASLGACTKRCHCYGRDGSHTYFTKEQLAEKDRSCVDMETVSNGLIYSLCEYDHTSY